MGPFATEFDILFVKSKGRIHRDPVPIPEKEQRFFGYAMCLTPQLRLTQHKPLCITVCREQPIDHI